MALITPERVRTHMIAWHSRMAAGRVGLSSGGQAAALIVEKLECTNCRV